MNEILAAVIRCAAVAVLALIPAICCWRGLRGGPKWWWAAVLAPLFLPPLVISYAFTLLPWSWTVTDSARAAIYVALLVVRGAALACALRLLLPRTDDPAAWWLRRRHRLGPVAFAGWCLRGPWRGWTLAGCAVFLVTFAEFDLASRLAVTAVDPLNWTVALYDLHVAGRDLVATLGALLPALLCQVPALALLVWVCRGAAPAASHEDPPRPSRLRWPARAWAVFALATIPVLPLVLLASHVGEVGWSAFDLGGGTWRRLATTGVFAAVAAGLALSVVAGLRRAPLALAGVLLPGLLGALALALLVHAGLQLPVMRGLRGTPFPLLAVEALLLAPLALVLLLGRRDRDEAAHCAAQAAGDARLRARLWWHYRARPWFWAWALLSFFSLHEVVAASILEVDGIQSVTVLLYQQMHYGHYAALSARILLLLAVPLAAFCCLRAATIAAARVAIASRAW